MDSIKGKCLADSTFIRDKPYKYYVKVVTEVLQTLH